ncbi:SusC/RagA family TonB-linked outer membrane protein [Marinilabiliaceae bacterium JC040]|nr:SusC/RagA family TonB-linked outer membrane protein [Marinilabiliaceae bacterium JC040]
MFKNEYICDRQTKHKSNFNLNKTSMKKLIGLIACILLLGVSSVFAQTVKVSGTVTDKSGQGLPGVSVSIIGTTVGTTTDMEGKWTLNASPSDVIEFSSLSMITKKVKVGNQTVINVVLKENRVLVDEVMVVAYGTAKKESFTGSATSVKKEDIIKVAGSVGKKLQGKVAGVQVIGGDIRIRGFGSLKADATPLYVVDGVVGAPKPEDEDIETLTVLKDAASTALYGSRGANGVIIIESKKGKKDMKPTFTVKYQKTISKLIEPEWDILDAAQYFRLQFQGANYNIGRTISNISPKKDIQHNPYNMDNPYMQDKDGKWILNPKAKLLYNSNWKDEALKMAQQDDLYVSVAGGTSTTNYHWSVKAYDYDGNIEPSYSKGINSRFNFKSELSDRISVSLNTRIGYAEGSSYYQNKPNENNKLYLSYILSPCAPIYAGTRTIDPASGLYKFIYKKDKQGRKVWDWMNPNYKDYNPLALMEMDWDKSYSFSAYISPQIDIKIIDGLNFVARGSARFNTNKGDYWQNPYHGSGQTENGLSQRNTYHSRYWTMFSALTYGFKLAEDHHFDVFLGYESNDYDYESFYGEAKGYLLGDVSTELTSGEKPKRVGSGTTESAMISYISNFKYNLLEKYYLSASYRRDGSSKFGSENRWGNFWSVGASWRISQESFMSSMEWINNLKIRASYGVLGTDAIGDYQYGDYYSFGANYNGITGISHTNLPNETLGWEQSDNYSVGLDFDLFKGSRLAGTLEWYYKNTDGLLYSVALPYTTGFPNILKNIGEMHNTGIEIELTGKILTGDFKWTANATFSTVKNEITSLPVKQYLTSTKRWREGGSRYDLYMQEWAGVNKDNGDPLWYTSKDKAAKNASGKEMMKNGRYITNLYEHAEKYDCGKSTPDAFWGFTNNFEYKGFDLSFQWIGAWGSKIYDGRYATFMHDGSDKVSNLSVDALDAWTPDNKDTDVPKFIFANNNASSNISTRWLVDGDFVKLKNITLGYTLSRNICKSMKLNSLRVYATVDNLYTISDYKSGDPEISLSGISAGYTMPTSTTVRFGININF